MATINIPGILKFKLLLGSERYKCGKSGCRGWKNGDGYEFKIQTEKCLKDGGKEVKEVDELRWHKGLFKEQNYMEFMSELKTKAPPNGRVVILFKAKCGCPYAKFVAYGSGIKQRDPRIEERIKSGEASVCSICEKNYENNSEIKELPCYHFFHKACIDKSLKNNDLCPLCDSLNKSICNGVMDESWEDMWDNSLDDDDVDFVMV